MEKVLSRSQVDDAGPFRRINEPLTLAILRLRPHGIRAGDVAVRAGISHPRLSRMANGWAQPSRDVAERIASVVGEPIHVLFPDAAFDENERLGGAAETLERTRGADAQHAT